MRLPCTIKVGVLLLVPTLTYAQRLGQPPAVFVDRGACPGECCTYGVWRATRAVQLYAEPTESSQSVGRLRAGATVLALTGHVRTTAGKFVVRRASPPYRARDVIWVYTRLGEGWYRVWRAGRMVNEEISVIPDHQHADDWGYFARAPLSVWWVKVRLQNDREGWTNASERFTGTHLCG